MALSWNIEDVEDFEELYIEEKQPAYRGGKIEEKLRTWADLIIDYCGLIIGIPEITEDNWKEVYRRIHLYERLSSPGGSIHLTTIDGPTKRYIKPEEVKRMIGLTTNGTREDRDEFAEKMFKSIDRKVSFDDLDDLKLDERDEWFQALRDEEQQKEEAEV